MGLAESPPPSTRHRLPTFDVLRGALLVLITASHLGMNLAPEGLPAGAPTWLGLLLSGTVGFATVSGIVFGVLAVRRAQERPALEARYRAQGVRLLLVAHGAIALLLWGPSGGAAGGVAGLAGFAARTLLITDVLALVFLVVVPRATRASGRARLVAGLTMIVAGRALVGWAGGGEAGALGAFLAHLGGGWRGADEVLRSAYGVLPITGMFLVGSFVGERVARAERAGRTRALAGRLLVAGVALVALSAWLVAAWLAGKRGAPVLEAAAVRRVLFPDAMFSLYPAYLGATLVAAAGLLAAPSLAGLVPRALATLGKASLVVYVAQYLLVQTIPWALGWRGAMSAVAALAYLAPSVALLHAVAGWWLRRGSRARDEAYAATAARLGAVTAGEG